MDYYKLAYVTEKLKQEGQEQAQAKAVLRGSAEELVNAGRLKAAEAHYRELIDSYSKDATLYHDLGMVLYQQKRSRPALQMLLKSLEIDRTCAQVHFDLGQVCRQGTDRGEALQAYVQTLGLEAGMPNEKIDHKSVEHDVTLLEQAETYCQRLIGETPGLVSNYLKLGYLSLARNSIPQAIKAFQVAYQVDPKNALVLENMATALHLYDKHARAAFVLGHAYYLKGLYHEAIESYRKGVFIQPGDVWVYHYLAFACQRIGLYDEAIEACKEGVRHHPKAVKLYHEWAKSLERSGRIDEHVRLTTQTEQLFPDDWYLARQRYLALPVIYNDIEEIGQHRSRFTRGLQQLQKKVNLEGAGAAPKAIKAIQDTNFFLGYQGQKDLDLQKQYGQLVCSIMQANHPQWSKSLALPALEPDNQIRVGYVSSCMHFHTVGKHFLGWLQHHDATQFKTYTYSVGDKVDFVTHQFQQASDQFYHFPHHLDGTCRQIVADRLHVLVILDIGMDPITAMIGSLRLAPVQCAAWGHPITTGLPTIDYFISNELMEPDNAAEHYSEELVRLSGIGVSIPQPYIPESRRSRADFGLSEDAVVYLSPQSLFKYLPQFDYLYPAIAQRVSRAQIVLVKDHNSNVTQLLHDRLQMAFRDAGVPPEKHLVFLPRQDYFGYFHLNRVADVFLDSPGWSGGMTTLEALGCSLPVVTVPGDIMRARQSYAFLTQLGVTETVAADLDEYVDIAVRLGSNEGWRQDIREKTTRNLHRLYNDPSCVAALETFYRRVVRG